MNTLVFDTLQQRWRVSVTRPLSWPAVAAMGLMLVLLFAFYAVVSDAVDEARTRRAAAALRARTALHCNAPRNVGPRADCAQEPTENDGRVASR